MLSKNEDNILAYMNGSVERGMVRIENFESQITHACHPLLSFVNIQKSKVSKEIRSKRILPVCLKQFVEDHHFHSVTETPYDWV
jgi:hypothetical protein